MCIPWLRFRVWADGSHQAFEEQVSSHSSMFFISGQEACIMLIV